MPKLFLIGAMVLGGYVLLSHQGGMPHSFGSASAGGGGKILAGKSVVGSVGGGVRAAVGKATH
jgi:hypothetical protein